MIDGLTQNKIHELEERISKLNQNDPEVVELLKEWEVFENYVHSPIIKMERVFEQLTKFDDIVYYIENINTDFETATPQEILYAIQKNHTEKFEIGKTKSIKLTNGVDVVLRLVDNRPIIKKENGEFGGLVIEFLTLYKKERMNVVGVNEGGWNESYMRNNVIQEIWDVMPNDWKSIISKAEIQTMNGGNQEGTMLVTSLDYLWIPAEREIFETKTYSNNDEWEVLQRFKYYKDNDLNTSRIKQYDDSNSSWWLRTANSNLANSFVYVNSNGDVKNINANLNYGVSPCFVI